MYVLCSRQVAIFSDFSHPWKPQYPRFSFTTFIVITGCFSFCILAGLIARKKPQRPFPQGFLYFTYFSDIKDTQAESWGTRNYLRNF